MYLERRKEIKMGFESFFKKLVQTSLIRKINGQDRLKWEVEVSFVTCRLSMNGEFFEFLELHPLQS